MRKISMKRKSKTANADVPEDDKSGDETPGSSQEQDVEESTNGSPAKKGKKGKRASKANEENGNDKKKGKNKDTTDEEDEEEYEVEKVVGDKMVKGVRHFLIRWKGHTESSDTWEPESTLNCDDLINDYLSTKEANPSKTQKKGKPSKDLKKKKKETSQNDKDDEESGEEVYEVDKIIEVYFKKNGQREFLVHWKGYSANDNTWEPEEHMNCPDLIEKFMSKVEKAKSLDTKELRVKRKPTDRFTVLMEQSGRKLSKRNTGKQRVHYYDAE